MNELATKNRPSPVGSIALMALQKTMAQAGWEINYVDLDLTGERARAEIKVHRMDGRWLWARVDSLGRCTVETFHRETSLGRPANAKGRWPQSPQINDLFLGRVCAEGPRAMLRYITSYLAENALHPVALADIRKAWAGVMTAPVSVAMLA